MANIFLGLRLPHLNAEVGVYLMTFFCVGLVAVVALESYIRCQKSKKGKILRRVRWVVLVTYQWFVYNCARRTSKAMIGLVSCVGTASLVITFFFHFCRTTLHDLWIPRCPNQYCLFLNQANTGIVSAFRRDIGTSLLLDPPPPPPTKSMLTKHFKRTEANSTTFRCVLWDHYFKNLTGFFQVFSEIPRLIYILEGSRTVYFSKPTSPFWNIIDLLRKSDVNCFYFVYLIGIFTDRFFSRQKSVCCSLKRGSPLPYLGIMKSDQGTYCYFNI